MSCLINNLILSRTEAPPAPVGYSILKSFTQTNSLGYQYDPKQSASALLGNLPSIPTLVLETRNSGNGSTKFTCSFWIKGNFQGTIVLNDPIANDNIYFSNGSLHLIADPYFSRGEYFSCNTFAVFKDTSNWHHFAIIVDTTLATAGDRIKIYSNGVLLNLNDMVYSPPPQNQTFSFYAGNVQISKESGTGAYSIADFKYIDNQALAISSLGQTNTTTGEWEPISYTFTNSANDNSYELLFEDTDSSSLTDFGKDTSGNSLNFTPYAIDVANATDNSHSVFINSDLSTPDSYLSLAATSGGELDFGYNVDWSVEFWILIKSPATTGLIFGNDDRFINFTSTLSANFSVAYSFSNGIYINFNHVTNSESTNGVYAIQQDRWHHVAATMSGTTGRFFVNGTLISSWTTDAAEGYAFNADLYSKFGGDSTNCFQGFISNLRVVRGSALYTSAFTPPSTQLTAITGTELLTFRSSTITDLSSNSFSITSTGSVRASVYSPFEPHPTYEVSYDSPTKTGTNTGLGGEQSGSYCVIDHAIKAYGGFIKRLDSYYAAYPGCLGSFSLSSGKWYWEVVITSGPSFVSTDNLCLGVVANYKAIDFDPYGSHTNLLSSSTPYSHLISSNSLFYNNGSTSSNSTSLQQEDVIGVALDITNLQITFYKNGTQVGSAQTLESGQEWTPVALETVLANSAYPLTVCFNYGQSKYYHTAPSGFLPLNTNNLTSPTIPDPRVYIDVISWTGNGSSQSFSSLGFDPGLVIITQYNDFAGYYTTDNRHVYDKNGGAQSAVYLNTNASSQTHSTGLTAFQSGGFTLGSDNAVNENNELYTAVCFATPASSTVNNSGTIASTVRANTASGVSVISYTGSGSNASFGHGLSSAPSMVLVKNTSNASSWAVWHKEIANTEYLTINGGYDFPVSDSTVWNSLSPTASLINIGTSSLTNANTDNYRAYCFSEIEGFSSAGKYTIGANEQYKMIYTGFKPSILWIKAISGSSSSSSNGSGTYWYQITGERNKQTSPFGAPGQGEYPKCAALEEISTDYPSVYGPEIQFCSNGFYMTTSSYQYNYSANGYTYIYYAWASSPIKHNLSGF